MNLRFRFGPSDLFPFTREDDLKIGLTKSSSRLSTLSFAQLRKLPTRLSIQYLSKLHSSFLVLPSHKLALTLVSRFVYLQHSQPKMTFDFQERGKERHEVHTFPFTVKFFCQGALSDTYCLQTSCNSLQDFTNCRINAVRFHLLDTRHQTNLW
jgi:hypothetical protein